jgi:transposase
VKEKHVTAEVSQASREAGRMPVERRSEQLSNRREHLVREKRRIENELSQLDSERRDETAMLLRRHGGKSQQVLGTIEIDAKYGRQRSALIREKTSVELELGDLKRQARDKPRNEPTGGISEKMVVLLNIEALLKRVVKLLEEKKS